MKRREVWGSALNIAASICAWADSVIYGAFWAAAREDLLLYAGIPGDSIAAWFRIVALFLAATSLLLLLPALIGRIPRKVPRRVIGWTTTVAAAAASPFIGTILLFTLLSAFGIGDTVKVTAADGPSVLIFQDGFDGDIIEIYYKRVRSASEISTYLKETRALEATLLGLTGGRQTGGNLLPADHQPHEAGPRRGL